MVRELGEVFASAPGAAKVIARAPRAVGASGRRDFAASAGTSTTCARLAVPRRALAAVLRLRTTTPRVAGSPSARDRKAQEAPRSARSGPEAGGDGR